MVGKIKGSRRAQRLARREAARLRRAQREQQAKKDWLHREIEATALHSAVIKRKWRDIMRRLRTPQLLDDLLALRLRSERLLDSKASMIDDLMEALDEANGQHDANLQHHVEVVDRILELFHSQMASASERYRCSLASLGEGLTEQVTTILGRRDRDQSHLSVILFAMRRRRIEGAERCRGDTTAKKEEEALKLAERFQSMQTRLERCLERQWTTLQATLEDHQQRYAERRADVARLRAREEAERWLIAEQRRRTRQLHRQIEEGVELVRAWNIAEATPDTLAVASGLQALRHERDQLRGAYLALRTAMDAHRQHDRRQISHLVVLAEAATSRLQDVATLGERILTLSCLCNTLETDEERRAYPESDGCDYRESAFWVRGLVDQRGPEAALGALTVVTAIPCAECSSEASETGHTCFTNDAGDLAAEVASAASTEDAVDQWQAPRTRKMPSFDLEEVEDLMGETANCLEGLASLWERAGVADAERRRLHEEVSRLRVDNTQLHAQLRVYLRCLAPSPATWSGPDHVPRGDVPGRGRGHAVSCDVRTPSRLGRRATLAAGL